MSNEEDVEIKGQTSKAVVKLVFYADYNYGRIERGLIELSKRI